MGKEIREYVEPEKIPDDLVDAINKVIDYCGQHKEFEDCRRCVLGDGIYNCGCTSPYLWKIRNRND